MRWTLAAVSVLIACVSQSTPVGHEGGDPACPGQPYAACYQGDVYRFDACGQPDSLLYECREVLCADGACQPATCDDGLRNSRESDIDCGGGCPGCAPGQVCLTESDCESRVCTDRACATASCEDDVTNGDESDADCGGSCPRCSDWSACQSDDDCVSANCGDGTCLPGSCNDGTQNGSESDVDCGGSCAACPGGRSCNGDDDCQSRDCDTVCADFQCPAGMVRIGELAACVDPYEASVWQNSDCTGVHYGSGLVDDYPVGFPDLVASSACAGTCRGRTVVDPTTEVYACSVAGVLPSANLTWFQARRACESSGKVLCRWPLEWLQACWGPNENKFPYGDGYVSGRCNDGFAGGAVAASGSFGACQGGGVFDASGNLWEWTDTCVSDDVCRSAGGSYAEVGEALLSCTTGHVGRAPDYAGETLGLRCCWRP